MPPLRLELSEVSKRYGGHLVLENVTVLLEAGDTLGIMGPSGAGKTTLARIVTGVERPDTGTVLWDEDDIGDAALRRRNRRRVQIMVQDPSAALNPVKTAGRLLLEVPVVRRMEPLRRDRAVREALRQVGLSEDILSYKPPELSGGMNQRIMLARLLLAGPDLLVFDEPTSGLDLSLQATILHLIREMKGRCGFTYILISHDADVLRFMCRRVVRLKDGRLWEE